MVLVSFRIRLLRANTPAPAPITSVLDEAATEARLTVSAVALDAIRKAPEVPLMTIWPRLRPVTGSVGNWSGIAAKPVVSICAPGSSVTVPEATSMTSGATSLACPPISTAVADGVMII